LIAVPLQDNTALASPTFAQYILLDIIKQIFAVAPHLYDLSPYYLKKD